MKKESDTPTLAEALEEYQSLVDTANQVPKALRDLASKETDRARKLRCLLLGRPLDSSATWHELFYGRLQFDVPYEQVKFNWLQGTVQDVERTNVLDATVERLREGLKVVLFPFSDNDKALFVQCSSRAVLALYGINKTGRTKIKRGEEYKVTLSYEERSDVVSRTIEQFRLRTRQGGYDVVTAKDTEQAYKAFITDKRNQQKKLSSNLMTKSKGPARSQTKNVSPQPISSPPNDIPNAKIAAKLAGGTMETGTGQEPMELETEQVAAPESGLLAVTAMGSDSQHSQRMEINPIGANQDESGDQTHTPTLAELQKALMGGKIEKHIKDKLGGRKIDEVMMNDPEASKVISAIYKKYPYTVQQTTDVGGSVSTERQHFEMSTPGVPVPTVIAYHNLISAKMRNCIKSYLFFELTLERYKDDDNSSARGVRLLTVEEDMEGQEMYIFFGKGNKIWATRGHHDPHPVAKFLFLLNDWMKFEGLYSFLSTIRTDHGVPWNIQKRKDTSTLVSVGKPFDWHNDGQLNLYQLPTANSENTAPSNAADILVNTLVFAINEGNLFAPIKNKNGTFEIGVKQEGNGVIKCTGRLNTNDGTLGSQYFGCNKGEYVHRGQKANDGNERMVLSYRDSIPGTENIKKRYDNADHVCLAIKNADFRYKTWIYHSTSAQKLRCASNHSKQGANIRSGVSQKKNGQKKKVTKKARRRTKHKLPRKTRMLTAYKRILKTIAMTGLKGWEYVCQRNIIEYLLSKGIAGISLYFTDTKNTIYVGVPHIDGELVRMGKTYRREKIDELHHMTVGRKRGNNTWSTRAPITGVSLVQPYKNNLQQSNSWENILTGVILRFFGAGGSGYKAGVFGNDSQGSATFIAPHPQSPGSTRNMAMQHSAFRRAVVYLYRAYPSIEWRQALGLWEVISCVIRLPTAEEIAEVQNSVKQSELKYTSYLTQPCYCFEMKKLVYDEAKLLKASESGPRYLRVKASLSAKSKLAMVVPNENFKAATEPVLDSTTGQISNKGIVTPEQTAKRKLEQTNLDQFAVNYQKPRTQEWDGRTDEERELAKKRRQAAGNIDENDGDEDDDSNDSTPISAEQILDHSNLVAVSADARAIELGHSKDEKTKAITIKTLAAKDFVGLGAVQRVHPASHPTRLVNPTTNRYMRAALEYTRAQGIKEITNFVELRQMLNKSWLQKNHGVAVDLLFAALVNQMVANPHMWEDFAKHQQSNSTKPLEATTDAYWQYMMVLQCNWKQFLAFLDQKFAVSEYTGMRDIQTTQYTSPFSDRDSLKVAISGLPAFLKKNVPVWLTENGSTRKKFIEETAKWMLDITKETKIDKFEFMTAQGLQDAEEVTNFPLGIPEDSDQVCGYGSKFAMRCIRAYLQKQAGGKKTSWTYPKLLSMFSNAMRQRATKCEFYRSTHHLTLKEKVPVHQSNERPMTCGDAESDLCEGCYRPFKKTTPSYITDHPDGYNNFTHPNLLEVCNPMSADDLRHSEASVEAWMARKDELRPNNVFCLPTENLQEYPDAFDSGDEEKEKIREGQENATLEDLEANDRSSNEEGSSDEDDSSDEDSIDCEEVSKFVCNPVNEEGSDNKDGSDKDVFNQHSSDSNANFGVDTSKDRDSLNDQMSTSQASEDDKDEDYLDPSEKRNNNQNKPRKHRRRLPRRAATNAGQKHGKGETM